MSLQNIVKTLKTAKNTHPDFIYKLLISSSEIPPLGTATESNLSDLNPTTLHQILSDTKFKPSKCLYFFDFLLKNQSLISFEPALETHLALVHRLLTARKFSDAENLLKSVIYDEKRRYPFRIIASGIESLGFKSKTVSKFSNVMFKVYSDNMKFIDALEVFDYMKSNGIKIDERACTIHLLALKKSDMVESAIGFFNGMIQSGVKISVYALTIMVDCLCSNGEIKVGRELVEEMIGKGVKPSIVTYNTMIDSCVKRWNFSELDSILELMEKEKEVFSTDTYKILIDGFTSYGKVKEAENLVLEMHGKGLRVDTYLYNLIINGYAKKQGLTHKVYKLFNEMGAKGVNPNADTYFCLIRCLCNAGEVDAAIRYASELHQNGVEIDEAMFRTLIEGYCGKGMVNEAYELLVEMVSKGYEADVLLCDKIATGLCELNQDEEAMMLLNMMVKRGVSPRTIEFADSMRLLHVDS